MAPQEPPPRRATVGDPTVQGKAPTAIDRRTCHRVVPMKVMSFGLSRTGTGSMRQALLDLGYDDCYHYTAVFNENPPDAAMWAEAIDAKFNGKGKPFVKADWDQLLGHCMAVTDTPCQLFWRELREAYPDAKIILTVRDNADVWADSMAASVKGSFVDTLYPDNGWYERLLRRFYPVSSTMLRYEDLLINSTPFFESITTGKEESKKYYEAHNDAVRKAVPQGNLLLFNVKQGWKPLCEFLGKDVPPWDFPRMNERGPFRATFLAYSAYCRRVAENRMRWALTALVGGIAVIGAGVYYRPAIYGLLADFRRAAS